MATAEQQRGMMRTGGAGTAGRWLLIGVMLAMLGVFLLLPLVFVFVQALERGAVDYFVALGTPDTIAAIRLTLLVAAIALPLNATFGLCAAWCITKFDFRGKSVLVSLIDLPFSVS